MLKRTIRFEVKTFGRFRGTNWVVLGIENIYYMKLQDYTYMYNFQLGHDSLICHGYGVNMYHIKMDELT